LPFSSIGNRIAALARQALQKTNAGSLTSKSHRETARDIGPRH